jgi:hypothetical protein
LARDPRSATYDRLWDHDSTDGGGPFIELLDAMRRRVGVEASHSGEVAPGVDGRHPSRDAERAGQLHRWSLSARVRVRARNVLRRWAAAQTDPRLVWVDPLAPAGNFVMIADLFWSLRLSRTTDPASVELDEADLDDLWLRWLRPFVGTGEADGWLDRLDAGERSTAVKRMPEGVRAKVAALCWLLARPGAGQRERVVGCQRVVEAALQQGFLEPSAETATYLAAVTGKPVTRDSVDSTLLAAIAFVDDRLWCDRVSKELEVHDLSLEDVSSGGTPRVRIHVGGIADPLLDTRVPRLVAGIRRYRRCNDVALFSTDHEWRLSVHTGDKIAYLGSAGNLTESVLSMQDGTLEAIARDGGVLSNLFVRRLQAVG